MTALEPYLSHVIAAIIGIMVAALWRYTKVNLLSLIEWIKRKARQLFEPITRPYSVGAMKRNLKKARLRVENMAYRLGDPTRLIVHSAQSILITIFLVLMYSFAAEIGPGAFLVQFMILLAACTVVFGTLSSYDALLRPDIELDKLVSSCRRSVEAHKDAVEWSEAYKKAKSDLAEIEAIVAHIKAVLSERESAALPAVASEPSREAQ
ncbi:MAG: hypothetical protein ACK4FJ_05545 [Ferrovibrio sp.]|uniref:hypothetical protein n=1 Tax=Ferrovibrio sp. TaxID=1917215 RepID=UPI00391AA65F